MTHPPLPDPPTARAILSRHLDILHSRHVGVFRRLYHESGLLVVVLVLLAGFDLLARAFSIDGLVLLAVAVIPSALLLAYGVWLDRHEPEPAWLLLRCLIWGALLAALTVGVLYEVLIDLIDETLLATVVAPLAEEGIKAVALFWLLRHYRSHVNGGLDTILYALFIGLGFTVTEDFAYYLNAYLDDESSVIAVVLARTPTALLHPLFTAITAFGLVLGSRSSGIWRFLYPFLGFDLAVLLHGMWNSELSPALKIGLYLPLSIALLRAAAVLSARERDTLTEYVAASAAGPATGGHSDFAAMLLDPRPGLAQWFVMARDPDHSGHREWRARQLAWIAASPEAARALARDAGHPGLPASAIREEAGQMLAEIFETPDGGVR